MLEQQQQDLIELQIALEPETEAHFRADREWSAQKKLAQNLKNQLNKLVQSQRALELQINTAGGGVENELEFFSPEEKVDLLEHDVTILSTCEFNAAKPNPPCTLNSVHL